MEEAWIICISIKKMEDKWEVSSQIVVVRGSSDILSALYISPFNDGGAEFPSVEHYCQFQILSHVGQVGEAQKILDISTAVEAAGRGAKMVRESLPPGTSPSYASTYMAVCRDSFLREGYKQRFEKDANFRAALQETGKSLLISCDDMEDGIGMDEGKFWLWVQQEKISAEKLFKWMMKPRSSDKPPRPLGKNRLGKVLMGLRDGKEIPSTDMDDPDPGSSADSPEPDQKTFTFGNLTVSEQVIALEGIFQPLSHLYPTPILVKGRRHRSVQHYVYARLFEALKLGPKALEKLLTTSHPEKLRSVASQVLSDHGKRFGEDKVEAAWLRSAKWYKKAMKAKFQQYGGLLKLLLSTGKAILIETADTEDKERSIGTTEREVQHLLTKKYVTPQTILEWMELEEERPKKVAHLGHNRSGSELMELRQGLGKRQKNVGFMPLTLPPDPAIYGLLSEHMICFTAESVFHPNYDAPMETGGEFRSVQHFVCAEGARYFGFPASLIEELKEAASGVDVLQRFRDCVRERCPPVEQLFAWEYSGQVEAVKAGLRLRFQQNPSLLRALLDTGDALLVYCKRYESKLCEWGVGMRERDVRGWMHTLGMDSHALTQLCSRPLAKRPPFLGGNRLGFLLMELRREFTLQGVFPHNLPLLPMGPDMILGSESLMEDVDSEGEAEFVFSVWTNPLLLMAKAGDDEDLWEKSRAKGRERVWREQQREEQEVIQPEEALLKPLSIDKDELNEMDETGLRIYIMEYISKLRGILHASEIQEEHMRRLEGELTRIRTARQHMMRTIKPPKVTKPSDDEEQKLKNIRNKLAELISQASRGGAKTEAGTPPQPKTPPPPAPQAEEEESDFIPAEEFFRELSLQSDLNNDFPPAPEPNNDFPAPDLEAGEVSSEGDAC